MSLQDCTFHVPALFLQALSRTAFTLGESDKAPENIGSPSCISSTSVYLFLQALLLANPRSCCITEYILDLDSFHQQIIELFHTTDAMTVFLYPR